MYCLVFVVKAGGMVRREPTDTENTQNLCRRYVIFLRDFFFNLTENSKLTDLNKFENFMSFFPSKFYIKFNGCIITKLENRTFYKFYLLFMPK